MYQGKEPVKSYFAVETYYNGGSDGAHIIYCVHLLHRWTHMHSCPSLLCTDLPW